MPHAVYSTASLKESQAQSYKTMTGKIHNSLLRALDVMGFEYMTPVQSKVLTELPSFRSDCLVQAKTGTGKTVAFLLPALHSLLTAPPSPKGHVGILILSPTRELALQIAKECDQLTSQLRNPLECHTAFGGKTAFLFWIQEPAIDVTNVGTARASNLNKFLNGAPRILVATPGRLKDYLSESRTASKLQNMQTLILDEADTMLEKGFLADVWEILKLLPQKDRGWQGMCFSATVPPKIKDVVSCVLNPGYSVISTIDKNEAPTLAGVPQYHVIIPSVSEHLTSIMALLKQECGPRSKVIVFGVTANMVALYAKVFERETPLPVYTLHSRLSQSARTRTTEAFKEATSGVMFASDVIGRGMDFPNVDLVVQVGLPSSGEQYVHRVGRTARAGNKGRAVILLTQAESFFLIQNSQLPIDSHPKSGAIVGACASYKSKIQQVMSTIEEDVKRKAYSACLGFFAGSGYLKPLRLDKPGLVMMANRFAVEAMHCPEPPPLERKTIGMMGLKGVPGIRYGGTTSDSGRSRHSKKHLLESTGENSEQAKSRGQVGRERRIRHQV